MSGSRELVAVYLRKRADLVRFFTKRTGSAAAAEDIVQEIYLKIAGGRGSEALQSPESYLYRVGINAMLDRAKQERRQRRRGRDWQWWAHGGRVQPANDEAPPEDALDARRRLEALMRRLDELPPRVARAFRMHRFEGRSHAEIAAELGVSRSSVEKYIMTALRHLLDGDPP